MSIQGTCDPAFAPVADVFGNSVATGAERGALCLRVNGRNVVNLFGGMAQPETDMPWRSDTLACCFSVTKGMFALLAHVLIDKGILKPDTRVMDIWSGFGTAGKDRLTVYDVLTHRAGLPAVSGNVSPGLLYDRSGMEAALATSAPVVSIGTPVYHNMTYGYLLGGILARVGGAPVEDLIERELTGPLDADFRIGLGRSDMARTATLSQDDPNALFAALDADPESLFARSMQFFGRGEDFNSVRWQQSVIGSGNGHATAAAIAIVYEQLIAPDGLLSADRQHALRCEVCRSDSVDPIMGMAIRYGEGVELSTPAALDFGPNPATVGYWGAGGAQGFADPDSGLVFGYVTGRMDAALGTSARAAALVAAAYQCL
ncbi:MAG: serine hydrolase [Rhodobacteraceae bacterium]|nr:serine hydrolase [Paracoccaceae bacterium]